MTWRATAAHRAQLRATAARGRRTQRGGACGMRRHFRRGCKDSQHRAASGACPSARGATERVESARLRVGHVIQCWTRRAPPAATALSPPAAMSGAAFAASRGLRSLSSRFARGGAGAPLRAALLASPPQPRPFRTSLVVEMGRRAAKIANRKARNRAAAAIRASRGSVIACVVRACADAAARRGKKTWRARSCMGAWGSRSWLRACPAARRSRAQPRVAGGRSRRFAHALTRAAPAPARRAASRPAAPAKTATPRWRRCCKSRA